jgi:hypothetical protein
MLSELLHSTALLLLAACAGGIVWAVTVRVWEWMTGGKDKEA